jgi:DNA helicase INO80
MLVYWKKNEREEKELKKKAEKEALERCKQEEEQREAQRQQRKLEFLITQTELYSHFLSKKLSPSSPIAAGNLFYNTIVVDDSCAENP